MLKHLLIIFFLLFSVACQNNDNATFKKWENRDIDGLKMIDTFNFQKKVNYDNNENARFNFTIKSYTDFTRIWCVITSHKCLESVQIFTFEQLDVELRGHLINQRILTLKEVDWLLKQVTDLEKNRLYRQYRNN